MQNPAIAKAALEIARPLIKAFEGCSLTPYRCPAGVPTIGYGCTRHPDGTRVTMGDRSITEAQADAYLDYAMERVEADLDPLIVPSLSPNQYAALISLAYNIGVGCHDGIKGDLADSALLAKLNKGDITGAADEFLVWDKAHVNGRLVVLPGLLKRRAAERARFLGNAA